jgi:hypothetical protein
MIVYTFLMDKDTTEVVEILNHVLAIMVTKDDLATLRSEMNEGFASVRAEMRDIRNRLDAIEAELKNHSGFAKEIDHLIERVRAIEEHLGIQHKIGRVANWPCMARVRYRVAQYLFCDTSSMKGQYLRHP